MSWWWAVQGCHGYLPGHSALLGDFPPFSTDWFDFTEATAIIIPLNLSYFLVVLLIRPVTCFQKSPPVVTTAEVSSEQTTQAESPEQPQAVTMAAASSGNSLSTVHVQTSPSYNSCSSIPVLARAMSEVRKQMLGRWQ